MWKLETRERNGEDLLAGAQDGEADGPKVIFIAGSVGDSEGAFASNGQNKRNDREHECEQAKHQGSDDGATALGGAVVRARVGVHGRRRR